MNNTKQLSIFIVAGAILFGFSFVAIQTTSPILASSGNVVLDLTKTANFQLVPPGTTVEYTFDVDNNSNQAVKLCDITDSELGAVGDADFGILFMGTAQFTESAVINSDTTNMASVTCTGDIDPVQGSDGPETVTVLVSADLRQCSSGDFICKEVAYSSGLVMGIILEDTLTTSTMTITVDNTSSDDWENVVVKDRFGAEIEFAVTDASDSCIASQGTATSITKGGSDKIFLTWVIGDIAAGDFETLVCSMQTDTTPGGEQSYTECGRYEYNSGANVKYTVDTELGNSGKIKDIQNSHSTPSVLVEVFEFADLSGDCDDDGFTDSQEIGAGTDPFDDGDFPEVD